MSGKKSKVSVKGCEGCPALCCSDLEDDILRPITKDEVDNLKWELHFENTNVFIRDKRWYQLTLGKCMYLGKDNLCTIYDERSQTCRDHMPPECEYYGKIYDTLFETPDDLQKFIDKEKKRKKRKRLAKAKGKK
jgi:Fe-S-cluster containining protein